MRLILRKHSFTIFLARSMSFDSLTGWIFSVCILLLSRFALPSPVTHSTINQSKNIIRFYLSMLVSTYRIIYQRSLLLTLWATLLRCIRWRRKTITRKKTIWFQLSGIERNERAKKKWNAVPVAKCEWSPDWVRMNFRIIRLSKWKWKNKSMRCLSRH